MESCLTDIIFALKEVADKKQALILSKFFKTGPGQYGEGDIFWGIKVPEQRKIAWKYWQVRMQDIQVLLASPVHEQRLVALLILVKKYEESKDFVLKNQIINFYLKNKKTVNNWDLVDLSAPKLLGDFIFNYLSRKEARQFLLNLASSSNLWTRRIAMVSTLYFIRQGKHQETFLLVKKLKNDKHDLIHKAMGWMLREVGKHIDKKLLLGFLDKNANILPRTSLRYAIEHLSEKQRLNYLKISKK